MLDMRRTSPAGGGGSNVSRAANAPLASPQKGPIAKSNAPEASSRRAQGWHTAVDQSSNPLSGERTTSILRRDSPQLHPPPPPSRRPSVQFSADTEAERRSTAPTTTTATSAAQQKRSEAAFRQNMAEFLGTMYGNLTDAPPQPVGPSQPTKAPNPSSQSSNKPGARGQQRKTSEDIPELVATVPQPKRGGGDRIDMLVDKLVRAYSSKFTGALSEPREIQPIHYRNTNSNVTPVVVKKNTPISRGGGGGGTVAVNNASKEVSTFVSQALDSFLVPMGPHNSSHLNSARSMLTSLGLDQEFAELLSFRTRSNLHGANDGDDEVTESTLLPMNVGEQALFTSVGEGGRCVKGGASVSKSLGNIKLTAVPPMIVEGDEDSNITAARRRSGGHEDGSPLSAASPVSTSSGWKSFAPRKVVPFTNNINNYNNNNNNNMSMISLDSRAVGMNVSGRRRDDNEDDSWGEVDAAAAAETRDSTPPLEMRSKVTSGAPTPLVSGMRSVQLLARGKAAQQTLIEEEVLKRNVLAAIEQQLRGYIVTTQHGSVGATTARRS